MSWSENGSSLNIFIVDMALSCYLREVYLMGNLQRINMKKTSVKLKYYVKFFFFFQNFCQHFSTSASVDFQRSSLRKTVVVREYNSGILTKILSTNNRSTRTTKLSEKLIFL